MHELISKLEAAGGAAGFRVEKYGEAGGHPLVALTRRAPGPRPRIYVSAGIHGDEPAAPVAVLDMIRAGVFDDRATWFLCPVLNPTGLAAGTRENAGGLDLNRDYRNAHSAEIRAHIAWLQGQPSFTVTLALHEDWESTGFYLYEQNPLGRPSLAPRMLEAVSRDCPIDASPVIDGREARGGIIRPLGDPFGRELWPESLYLRVNHTSLAYTLESPSAFPLPRRVRALRTAVEAAISAG
jgi:hypothetical protein